MPGVLVAVDGEDAPCADAGDSRSVTTGVDGFPDGARPFDERAGAGALEGPAVTTCVAAVAWEVARR